MAWNWQLAHWPHFTYDSQQVAHKERQFLLDVGSASACLKKIDDWERKQFIVEILSLEGRESSKIEGEILDRESLQSSIRKHFGLDMAKTRSDKESAMAELLCSVYETYKQPLTHEMLWNWHGTLFKHSSRMEDLGKYRTHLEPMQIVSNRLDASRVFFEAPPSERVPQEMDKFIQWFNATADSQPILERAALAHVYFESIHPFEDGNGRMGRILVEKCLSQGIGRPILIAVSKTLEKQKKSYYSALEQCNRTLEVTPWVHFFAEMILQAQKESLEFLYFIIEKSNMFTRLAGQLNERQEKALLRMFAEGPTGFQGGLSAEKYIAITKTSRATATRDLNELVEKRALMKTGELRHTRYWLPMQLKKEK